jgi:hypothetical protein
LKTERIRNKAVEILKERPMATIEILDRLNAHFKYGTSRHSLGNVLGKDTRFIKIDEVYLRGSISGGTIQKIWALRA